MSIYFPDGKGGKKLVGTDSGGGASYAEATTVASGLMSATDKAKLDSLNNYTLPTASENVKGGVKVGTGFAMDGDTIIPTFYKRFGTPPDNIRFLVDTTDGREINISGFNGGIGGYIYANGDANKEGGIIHLNGGTGNSNGGVIEMRGRGTGTGGTIYMTGSTGGTIDLSPNGSIKGNVVFTGTPTFLNGANGLTLPTASETVKGGVKIGTGLYMDGDTLNVAFPSSDSSSDSSSYDSGAVLEAGDGIEIDSGRVAVKTGDGLWFGLMGSEGSDGFIRVKLGDGLTFDNSEAVAINYVSSSKVYIPDTDFNAIMSNFATVSAS